MLVLENVSKTFYDKIIFNSLNLTVKKDDFIVIIGSNGAGKSTLLNIISGNVKVDSGKLMLDKQDITYLPAYKKARFIHRVYQDPLMGSSPTLSIAENLAIILTKNKGFGLKKLVKNKEYNLLRKYLEPLNLGLDKELDKEIKFLSGGQKQALALIMAFCAKPKILLLDEHTAALDPKTSELILKLTEELIKLHKIPTLMVTHNLTDAIKYGNRLIMLDDGKVLYDISSDDKKKLTKEELFNLFDN